MKRFLFISIMALAFAGFANAQESDQKALDIMEEVAEETKSYDGFYVEFTFSIHNLRDSTKQATDGKMWFHDKSYKLDMMNSVIHSDGETNWVYQEETGEVNITEHNEEETTSFINPYRFLDNFADEYTCRFVSDRFINNRPLVEVHLFPNDIEESTFSRIKLRLDKTKKELFDFTFVGKEGVNYTITINKLVSSKPVTKEMVSFNKSDYPDAEIIDMR
ncbi:MAG: LolA family protein [Bacteroidota bacterium]